MSDANYLLLLSKEALFYRTLSILLITKRRNFLNLDCAGILLRFYATSCCQLIYHRTAFLYNYINLLYHVIYGVIQGFPALRENKIFLHVCLISPTSCWQVTRLSRHLVRLMNEQQSLHHAQSVDVCQNFLEKVSRLLKHWEIRIAYRQWRSNFPRRGKPNYEEKNRKLRIQWLW